MKGTTISRNFISKSTKNPRLNHLHYNAQVSQTTTAENMDTLSSVRTCHNCQNILIFTYTCHSESGDNNDMRDFIACRSIQIIGKSELVCSPAQLCRQLDISPNSLDRIIPEHPRPRQFGEAGKITVDDLRPVMNRS